MNVLEICLGEGLGGLELYFRKCCKHLTGQHKVVVVTKSDTRLAKIASEEDEKHYAIKRAFKQLPLKSIRRLATIIKEEQIDLVHVHHKDDLPLVAWTKFWSRRSFKVVHTRQMQLPGSKKDLYHRFIYGSIDIFIAISDMLKADAQKKLALPNERIKRLYYGVEKADKVEFESHFVHNKTHFNVGVFSRIEYQKGQHIVLDAGKSLIKKYPDIEFYFVGDVMDEAYKDSLGKSLNLNESAHFHFKGFHPKPLSIMPCFDVIILPSKNETFGLVVVEAMRAGVAVIGTNAGGVPEIIDNENTGLLFDWEDNIQLAEQIERLYSDPNFKRKLAKAGEEKADELFDIDSHFKKLNSLFEEVVP
ncbi:MAG TPA: glycosyltransferase family 4 protein [Fulvivirga sp.]|nr:glycosyltransferase family 4 protein [Fulvivirga sp.]